MKIKCKVFTGDGWFIPDTKNLFGNKYFKELLDKTGIVELYTGIYDINKKDVYGGDVIEYTSADFYGIGVVLLVEGGFIIRWIKSNFTETSKSMLEISNPSNIKIIGDIYLNKDILNTAPEISFGST